MPQDKNKPDKFGLVPLPKQDKGKKDFSHHKVVGTLGASQIMNNDFIVAEPLEILNQYDLDFCAAFSTTEVGEDLIQIPLCPLWQMAKIKQVMGSWQSYGADLRSACKAAITFGFLPRVLSPFTHMTGNQSTDKDRDFIANWANWPANLDLQASPNEMGSYLSVDGPNDDFNNIRSALLNSKNTGIKQTVEFGLMWRPEWTNAPGGIIPEANYSIPEGDGHAIKFFGQKTVIQGKEPYLVMQQSWGDSVGDHGKFYFPRSVINLEAKSGFGIFIFNPASKSKAQMIISWQNLLTALSNLLHIDLSLIGQK